MSKKITEAISHLVAWLENQRLDTTVEKRTQASLERCLVQSGFVFEREKRLSGSDIVDFIIDIDGFSIAVEIKTKAVRKQIYRQLERYTQHDSVDGIVLLTGTAINLPNPINEKPSAVASLGAGWL